MGRVTVLIFHRPAPADAGPLEGLLADSRRALAERQRRGFLASGATEVRVVEGTPDDVPFGRRLRSELSRILGPRPGAADGGGVVVLGSGSLALARPADLRRFVLAAAGEPGTALANNRYSADAMAVARAADLLDLPDLPADNALPRWLVEVKGVRVADLADLWRLQVDLDGPADLLLLAAAGKQGAFRGAATTVAAVAPRFVETARHVGRVMADRRAELLVAGRVSSRGLAWLERRTACRVRALVEERGLRASSDMAWAAEVAPVRPARPPRSILGELLGREGPEALGRLLARLGDAAVVDSRVLLAHRWGADEVSWPLPEDRFASDLLLAERISDPWLRALTAAAAAAPIPVLLGGHSLLGPGLRLVAASR